MPRDLTASPVDRQNILNNPYAVAEIQKAAQIRGVVFEGIPCLTKEQVAAFFEVDPRTVERCLEQNAGELVQNGHEVIRGNRLQVSRLALEQQFGTDVDVSTKTTVPGPRPAFTPKGLDIKTQGREAHPVSAKPPAPHLPRRGWIESSLASPDT